MKCEKLREKEKQEAEIRRRKNGGNWLEKICE